MTNEQRCQLVRELYRAWETRDRPATERLLAEDFTFSSPPDPRLDRDGYFERCWPHAGHLHALVYRRLAVVEDEVLVTYEATRADGGRFRNTEIFGFGASAIIRAEVYFGWDLAASATASE